MTGYMIDCRMTYFVQFPFDLSWDRAGTHLEEHDDDQADDTGTSSLDGRDGANEDGTGDRVNREKEGGGDESEQRGTDESTNGESDKTVREHLSSLLRVVTTVVLGVVEEEGSDGDLGSHVHELGDESCSNTNVGGLLRLDFAAGSQDLGSLRVV